MFDWILLYQTEWITFFIALFSILIIVARATKNKLDDKIVTLLLDFFKFLAKFKQKSLNVKTSKPSKGKLRSRVFKDKS